MNPTSPEPSAPDADRSPPLRVATFNIRNGIAFDGLDSWPFRRRATAQAVARLDADLVGLQEVYGFQQRYLLRRLPGYAATGAGRTDGRRRGERCTVFYRRTRLALDSSTTRWFSETPDLPGSTGWGSRLPRIVTVAHLTDLASGRRFAFANCHLEGWPPAARRRSAAALVAWLDPDLPSIVGGDLNAEPDDEAVRTLLESGLRDVFAPRSTAPDAKSHQWTGSQPNARPALETERDARTAPLAPPTTTGGFRGRGERRRIDYVFVTREWAVDERRWRWTERRWRWTERRWRWTERRWRWTERRWRRTERRWRRTPPPPPALRPLACRRDAEAAAGRVTPGLRTTEFLRDR